ncbi:MAG: hypothetical protein H6748_00765 [Spirochaetaceae bacterium]|nr:hypothetical protein [Myxococcales bacterium]MCB9722559.1 hypothetical protein [Spirochaetaceae bacterium]HPG28993.1 hypothetical protein [Myxococcota bacterium]
MSESPTTSTPELASSSSSSDLTFDPTLDAGTGPALDAEPPRQTRTLTNSPGCVPARRAAARARGAMRTVRVDAWAVPASVSWSRTRRTVRKVARTPRGADWALPF